MQKRLIDVLDEQSLRIVADHEDDISELLNKDDEDILLTIHKLFTLGYLYGVRAERKRKVTHDNPWRLPGDDRKKGRC